MVSFTAILLQTMQTLDMVVRIIHLMKEEANKLLMEGNQNNREQGGRGRGGNKTICQICGRTGHATIKCYHRFDLSFQGTQQSTGNNFNGSGSNAQHGSYQAYQTKASTSRTSEDDNWYVDSGVTNHVTTNLQNLHLHQDYKGKGKLTVGNGSQLKISHIGDMFLNSSHPHKQLILHNTLHVPEIAKNLISISQFTKDNDVVIEFCSDCCLIKDKITKTILLEGALKQGFYQLNLSKVQPKSSKAQSLVSCFA